MALWMGGFTFYALVVIPTGEKVLGGIRTPGFITQQVTGWLNLIGVPALAILLWNVVAARRGPHFPGRSWLIAAWYVMVAMQLTLFLTHPVMDRLLDPESRKIHDLDRFEFWHQIYLIETTIQWTAAMLYIWLALRQWSGRDLVPGEEKAGIHSLN